MKRSTTNKKQKKPIDNAEPPTLTEAKTAAIKLESLKLKLDAIEEQKKQITAEAKQTWEILNRAVASFSFGAQRRSPVENPRPVSDKLIISAGRAIAKAVRNGNSLDEAKTAAVKAASKVGRRYGLAELPSEVLANIEFKAQSHFPRVSPETVGGAAAILG